ncbi:uncharacterized protein LOC111044238 [Nilaparvata lugens]|uniref:uncharacterized protein LOC111044238 n=1 Tax=Nilaparvata lugens TaxID=108931 RepID=UPI00193D64C3|nr:uncharacterized protein LOC111044238 [Nilaparvata lugens]XP_039278343.1 uncharacterized protein LOC111044238 [Nilaparvata lugens]
MEVMEEGHVMDRIRILLQRDSEYYEQNQSILQENLCSGIVGGVLDFPHHASFASIKMVRWWEEEHYATFRIPSGILQGTKDDISVESEEGTADVPQAAPSALVSLVAESSAQLLEHLHTLTQEALDHADLQVLTGTLGAAALMKNTCWVYNQQLATANLDLSLTNSYKQFGEMAESLAERLLDLHCRLVSLYVLQDADCLNWEHHQPFFEGERGSFVIQMWWLYMQGTREDLWTTVPPKMAQRVFAGMLNESLTILVVRYMQAKTSAARASLLVTDVANLLFCVRQLLPPICSSGDELAGCQSQSHVVRDVHAKCHFLLTCLLLRGAPLAILYKVFHKGLDSGLGCLTKLAQPSISPWIVLSSVEKLALAIPSCRSLPATDAISLELNVLLAQPQPLWPLILKVLMMRNCWVASKIMLHLVDEPCVFGENSQVDNKCSGFMCSGDCMLPRITVQQALLYIVMSIGTTNDMSNTLMPMLEKTRQSWGSSLDKNQVWNQKRPDWLEALIVPLAQPLEPVVAALNRAFADGASTEQGVELSMLLLGRMTNCLPPGIHACALMVEDTLSADISPMGDHVLVQLLVAALYKQMPDSPLAEALCSLQPKQLMPLVKCVKELEPVEAPIYDVESSPHVCEVQVSQLLLTPTGRHSLKAVHEYLKTKCEWLLRLVGQTPPPTNSNNLLYTMFHVGGKPFDQILSGSWSPDWMSLFQSPLGLTAKTIWDQLKLRSEFWEDCPLNDHDATVVAKLKTFFTSQMSE